MHKPKDVFIQYMYSNDNSFSETVPLALVLDEFDEYKARVNEEWIESDSLTLPRALYEITHLGFDRDMRVSTIQFSEKVYKRVKY